MPIVSYHFASAADGQINWYYDWDNNKKRLTAVRGTNTTTDRACRGEVHVSGNVYSYTLQPGQSSNENVPANMQVDPDSPGVSYPLSVWRI